MLTTAVAAADAAGMEAVGGGRGGDDQSKQGQVKGAVRSWN